jgi:hypothetical protein
MQPGAASADGRRFVAWSGAGGCVLFDDGLREVARLDVGSRAQSVQLNDDGSLLVVGVGDAIEAYDLGRGGKRARALTLPVRGAWSVWPCAFVRDEPVVCVASWDREPVLGAYDLRSGELRAEHPLPKRGGEGYWLVRHPEGEAMAAVAYSGQGEEWMFWAHYRAGRLRVFETPEIRDVSLPNFDPAGGEFLSHHESLGLCRMRFPGGELIGSVRHEEAFPENPGDQFGYDVHYLDAGRVLVWQTCLALYEFDLDTMRPTRRVLGGVEGKTFGRGGFFSGQSWPMAGNRLLTSDRQFDEDFRGARTTLRLWDASALYGPQAKCDPARPFTGKLLELG